MLVFITFMKNTSILNVSYMEYKVNKEKGAIISRLELEVQSSILFLG